MKASKRTIVDLTFVSAAVALFVYAGSVLLGFNPNIYGLYEELFGILYLAGVLGILYSGELFLRRCGVGLEELKFSKLYKNLLITFISFNIVILFLYKLTPQRPDPNNVGDWWVVTAVLVSVVYIFVVAIYTKVRIGIFRRFNLQK